MRFDVSRGLFLFFAAVIAGTLNALAGGGSFISFPALLFIGVPPVEANATNTVALWPGLAASAVAYIKRLAAPPRLLVSLLAVSVAGGWAGALLLLRTPQRTFLHLVPWLLLSGTLLFAFGNRFREMAGKGVASEDLQAASWRAIALSSLLQLLVSIYGGYYGAGIGFIILGVLAALGMRDVHAMGALRTLLAAAVNAAAVITFIVSRAVLWPAFLVMVLGALSGGWFGARLAQRSDPRKVRALINAVGLAMSLYFFVRS